VQRTPEILVDSDAFVGYFIETDAHNERVKALVRGFKETYTPLATTNLVVAETASLLSRRFSFTHAARFITYLQAHAFPVIFVDSDLQNEGYRLFLDQRQDKTSFVDCLNVVVARHYGMTSIFSFDKFYRQFALQLIA
jgi:predicted nucleic acid-binding protein